MEDKVEALVDAIASAIEEETGVAVEVEGEAEDAADADYDVDTGDEEGEEVVAAEEEDIVAEAGKAGDKSKTRPGEKDYSAKKYRGKTKTDPTGAQHGTKKSGGGEAYMQEALDEIVSEVTDRVAKRLVKENLKRKLAKRLAK
jgi:hypothetical protein